MSMETNQSYDLLPSREHILGEVKQIAAEFSNVLPDQVRDDHTLLGDLAWDSLDVVEFTMEIEEHFSITVPDELVEHAKTVGDVADGVLVLLGRRNPDG
jgi:acyl carrier protein